MWVAPAPTYPNPRADPQTADEGIVETMANGAAHRTMAIAALGQGWMPAAGFLSRGSCYSMLSIGSVGSILSIGSVGSILSVGSVGSVLSIGGIGCLLSGLSLGSILSLFSITSMLGVFHR